MGHLLLKLRRISIGRPYIFLMVVGIAVRLLVAWWYNYEVSIFGDSDTYTLLAERLSNADLDGYIGYRTPGYPFLILLAGLSENMTVLYQTILGVFTSLMLFSISRRVLKNTFIALIIGLSNSFFLHLLFYERAILTETLTMFCLTLSIWYLLRIDFFNRGLPKEQKRTRKRAVIIGLLLALLFSVRPMFIILPLWVAAFYVYKSFKTQKVFLLVNLLFILAPTLGGYMYWSYLNEQNTGYKSITTFSGINLAQNTVHFIEKASDEHAELRNLYVRKRDSMEAKGANVAMSVWRVYGELNQKQGLTVPEVSQLLGPMNKEVITSNFGDYISQVGRSWKIFWHSAMMWNFKKLKDTPTKTNLSSFWTDFQLPLTKFLKVFFVFVAGLSLFLRLIRRKLNLDFELFMIVLILGASLAQALVTYGSNERFSMPFFPLMILISLHFVYKNLNFKRQ